MVRCRILFILKKYNLLGFTVLIIYIYIMKKYIEIIKNIMNWKNFFIALIIFNSIWVGMYSMFQDFEILKLLIFCNILLIFLVFSFITVKFYNK